ncbi:unnamed protein product [Musa banksii]
MQQRPTLPTDSFLSATTKKEFHLSRCFFPLHSDLDRWLPRLKSISDGTPSPSLPPLFWFLVCVVPRLLSHPLIVEGGAPNSSAVRFSLISFSNWMIYQKPFKSCGFRY